MSHMSIFETVRMFNALRHTLRHIDHDKSGKLLHVTEALAGTRVYDTRKGASRRRNLFGFAVWGRRSSPFHPRNKART